MVLIGCDEAVFVLCFAFMWENVCIFVAARTQTVLGVLYRDTTTHIEIDSESCAGDAGFTWSASWRMVSRGCFVR